MRKDAISKFVSRSIITIEMLVGLNFRVFVILSCKTIREHVCCDMLASERTQGLVRKSLNGTRTYKERVRGKGWG